MLGLLAVRTSRHDIDGSRMNVAAHQRTLGERQLRGVASELAVISPESPGVSDLEAQWDREIDELLMIEAACGFLLLLAFAFAARIALQPTQEQLSATLAALADSESRTRAVLDVMQDGVLVISSTGDAVAWNPSALRIVGLPPDASAAQIAAVASQLKDEQGVPLTTDRLPSRITMRTGEPIVEMILSTTAPDGAVRWLSVNTSPLYRSEDAAPHAAVALIRDVTFARQVEEERAAQAEALAMQNQELLVQSEALERGHALFRSLVETAWAADGTLEAVEDPSRRFTIGVQWHPEAGEDAALFEALVSEARQYRAAREK